ncbi:hypothetical protein KIPE111705_34970 [Kibdelosporangium persicum]|uniref:DUF1707 domain-containing protein n=1 Tax=Kibdelosporangium persicum TaxID=2698649 RepID=A0ABX2EYI8_9PSEU|nr:hypothetical protein [Kibdelosporangium persicum]NRN64057.1 hypothetical protein [Kibdelosporangium persicum]
MSWQEDLRQLDQALAEGRIHADDYRKRRDQLLATATGATTPPAVSEPTSNPFPAQPAQPAPQPQPPTPAQPPQSTEATQVHQPGGQSPNSGPFPTPFRWEATNESTQIVGQQPGGNPDVTQVVGPQSGAEAERTQVVRPVGQPGVQHQAPWHSTPPAPNQGSPWGMEDQPMPSLQPTWLAQGPEVFAEDKGSKFGKGAKILVALVLVIGLGVGAYFVFFTGKDNNDPGATAAPPPPSQTSTSAPKPRDSLSIADLPGKASDFSQVKTFADAQNVKFLTPDEIRILTDAGAGKARLAVSDTPESINVLVFTTEATSAETATTARDKLAEQQLVYGATAVENPPTGVVAAKADKKGETPAFIRAHYAHKNTLVRIQVAGNDLVTVTEAFNDLLAEQLKILAANG